MCGIFGISIKKESSLKAKYRDVLKTLFILSESRGKEASGFALNNGKELRYLKSPFPASELVRSTVFNKEINDLFKIDNPYYSIIGHSRLVTNGYEQYNENNQPVIKNKLAVIHNGIIVNDTELWKKYSDEKKLSDLDSELIPTLLNRFKYNGNMHSAFSKLYEEIYGMTSIAVIPFDLNNLLLATNNGSVYFTTSRNNDAFIFASERYILNTLIDNLKLQDLFDKAEIKQLHANQICCVNNTNNSYEISTLSANEKEFSNLEKRNKHLNEFEIREKVSNKSIHVNTSMEHRNGSVFESVYGSDRKKKHQHCFIKKMQ